MIGTRERRPSTSDRLLGVGALVACGLLLASTTLTMLAGAAVAMVIAWGLFRIFGRREPASAV